MTQGNVTEATTAQNGSHAPDAVAIAVQVSVLAQSLAQATTPNTAEVLHLSHVRRVVEALTEVFTALNPVLTNLADTTARHASDHTLRDDRGGAGDGTAAAAEAALRDAAQALHRPERRLTEASAASGHLVDTH